MLFHEGYKLTANRYLVTLICFLLACNAFITIYRIQNHTDYYQPYEYRQVYGQLEGKTPEEAYAAVEETCRRLQGYELLYRNEEDPEAYETIGYTPQSLIADYQNSPYYGDFEALLGKEYLYGIILQELGLLTNYEAYLDSIDLQADQMSAVSLFNDRNSYSYRNIQKTPEDYVHLRGLQMTVAPSAGIEMATDSPATDVIAGLMILMVVFVLVSSEKEQGLMYLTGTMQRGGRKNGLVKLLVCMLSGAVIICLLYGTNLLINAGYYGLGNLGRSIQSVAGMNTGSLKISVAAYLIIYVLSKILALWCVTAILFLIAVVAKTIPLAFAGIAGTFGIFTALYRFIPKNSAFSILRYVNPIAFFRTYELYGTYQNRNLFGYPVSAYVVFYAGAFFILILCAVPAVQAYENMHMITVFRSSVRQKRKSSGRHTHLWLQETGKVLLTEKILFVLIGTILLRFALYQPLRVYVTADEVYYEQYITRVEGTYTEEKAAYIQDEKQRLDDLQSEMLEALTAEPINTLLILQLNAKLVTKNAIDQLAAHSDYLQTKVNSAFIDDRGWVILTGGEENNQSPIYLALILSALMILCTSEIIGIDYRTHMNQLIQTTYYSRRQQREKIIILILLLVLLYAVIYVPYYYRIITAYGLEGIHELAYSMEHLSYCHISIGTYLCLKGILRFVGFLVQTGCICLIARKAKNNVIVIGISVFLFILPLILMLLGLPGSTYFLLNPLIADF